MFEEGKEREENHKDVKTKAGFRREKTGISNIHSIGNRTSEIKRQTNPKKRNVYSIESVYLIEIDRTEAGSRVPGGRRWDPGSRPVFPLIFELSISA